MPRFTGISTELADGLRSGEPDAYGKPAERAISEGGAPCRCCLKMIPEGSEMFVFALRPFSDLQPYAETGPAFICADACSPYSGSAVPGIVESPDYLLKAYSCDERIIYGTGQVTDKDQISAYADQLLALENVAFVDLRSSRNNCWQARLFREEK